MAQAPTYREIISDIRKGVFAPVYLLMGEEPYYLDLIADWLEKSVLDEEDKDFDFEVFYGADLDDIGTVAASAQQFPLMAQHRLVMLKEAQSLDKSSTELQKLEGYALHAVTSTVLVIILKGKELPGTSKLVKAVKKAEGVVFTSPKIKEYQMGVPIKEYCADKKISIDPDAIDLMVSYLGNSLNKVFGEIDKLIVAGGKELNRITRKEVLENIGLNKEFSVFDFVKAMAVKDYAKSMTIVDYYASNPRQNPVVTIVSQLFKFFAQMTVAFYAPDKSDNSLMGLFGMHSSWQLKDLKEGMRVYNARQAVAAISYIRELDCKSKGIGSMQNEHDLLRECVFKILTSR